MTSIPIYDATAPVACTIGADEIPGRIQLLERLRSDLLAVEPTPDGFRLYFPRRDDIEADLHRFAVDEKSCCQFWGFAIDESGEGLSLRWDAPPGARDLLSDIIHQLQSAQPLTSLKGLL